MMPPCALNPEAATLGGSWSGFIMVGGMSCGDYADAVEARLDARLAEEAGD